MSASRTRRPGTPEYVTARRRLALARRARERRRARLRRVGVALVLAFLATTAWLVRKALRPSDDLPDRLGAEHFAGVLPVKEVAPVGTLLEIRLHDPPPAAGDFEMAVETAAGIGTNAGYSALRIVGPSGATLASGPMDDVVVEPPGQPGT